MQTPTRARVVTHRTQGAWDCSGMVDGLQYLHSQGIIHQDIRPSNLIVHYMDFVIVDFETSVFAHSSKEMIYEVGHICWPK
jgi:serine/threonine protein kinase